MDMKILETREVPGLARLYLAELPGDGLRMIEFVDTVEPGVEKADKWVLMISTQFGCAVGCRMCDAGAMGFHGPSGPSGKKGYPASTAALKVSKPTLSRNRPMRSPFLAFSLK